VRHFLSTQRDLHAYLHDQTLRLINHGYTGIEIAELIQLPRALERAWHTHGYYGSVSHNVKAIYQRYMGWYDGNPARLWQHPPVEAAKRYIDWAAPTRWSARPGHRTSQVTCAGRRRCWIMLSSPSLVTTKRRHCSPTSSRSSASGENGTWRDAYLSGVMELRSGNFGTPATAVSADVVAQLTPELFFDALAIQVNGPRAWDLDLAIRWHLPTTTRATGRRCGMGSLPTSKTVPGRSG
jgi:alkyl sulfatase BDS1-like metallo-beta-lactamase superfamily hydrolase